MLKKNISLAVCAIFLSNGIAMSARAEKLESAEDSKQRLCALGEIRNEQDINLAKSLCTSNEINESYAKMAKLTSEITNFETQISEKEKSLSDGNFIQVVLGSGLLFDIGFVVLSGNIFNWQNKYQQEAFKMRTLKFGVHDPIFNANYAPLTPEQQMRFDTLRAKGYALSTPIFAATVLILGFVGAADYQEMKKQDKVLKIRTSEIAQLKENLAATKAELQRREVTIGLLNRVLN